MSAIGFEFLSIVHRAIVPGIVLLTFGPLPAALTCFLSSRARSGRRADIRST
jgi:hypothetical protein